MLEPKKNAATAARVALKRVLIAEDDAEINDCLVRAFAEAGFEVASVRDGVDALRHLANARYDALILDLVMPGAGGMTILDDIRKRKLAITVMVVSNYLGALDEERYRQFGACRVFHKPFNFNELVAAVRRELGLG